MQHARGPPLHTLSCRLRFSRSALLKICGRRRGGGSQAAGSGGTRTAAATVQPASCASNPSIQAIGGCRAHLEQLHPSLLLHLGGSGSSGSRQQQLPHCALALPSSQHHCAIADPCTEAADHTAEWRAVLSACGECWKKEYQMAAIQDSSSSGNDDAGSCDLRRTPASLADAARRHDVERTHNSDACCHNCYN